MKVILVLLGILFICALVLACWYISTMNRIRVLSIKVDESLSGIDVALAKRYDVLTKMVEVVKGYAKHEKEVLVKVVELRKNMSVKELKEANDSMDKDFDAINVLVENYPDIKANENFKLLQRSIVDVEEHLQAARRIYNSSVSRYNQFILSYPSNIVAKRNNNTEKDFFEANKEEKDNVNIDLDKE